MNLLCKVCLLLSAVVLSNVGKHAQAQKLAFQANTIESTTIAVEPGSAWAIVFLGCDCPMARSYVSVLNQLQAEFKDSGARVVGVMSNIQDSREDIAKYASELEVAFPLVADPTGAIADQYGARRTPEAYLLDSELRLRYHGRIDDQYAPGVVRDKPTREDLRLALRQLTNGTPIRVKNTKALGCIIGRRRTSNLPALSSAEEPVTFSNQIARVLNRNCTECHREGDIGPFSMQSYQDVAGWADTMMETIDDGRMPPWHASPQHGKFSNARVMPEEDKELLRKWIALGTPEGDPDQMPPAIAPANSGYVSLSDLDAEFPMRDRPFAVPASGVVEYQYFVVDPQFKTDRWVKAAEVVPGSRDVVHHGIVFVRPPDGNAFRGVGWLTAYVPGQRFQPLPDGYARRIPAGSKFIFQMHYTPSGTERPDRSRLGIEFAEPDSVTHEVFTIAGLNQEFEIPPGESQHVVRAKVPRLPRGAHLIAATPHMHFRGRAFKLFAERGDSKSILLDVPNYDFNWQHTYHFEEQIALDSLDELTFEAIFDNSAANPFNPDPQQWVSWGDQTFEEMALGFFEVAVPLEPHANDNAKLARGDRLEEASRQKRIDAYVRRVFDAMDVDGDGVIFESEAPIVVRWRGFSRYDRNRDGKATDEEVREAAAAFVR